MQVHLKFVKELHSSSLCVSTAYYLEHSQLSININKLKLYMILCLVIKNSSLHDTVLCVKCSATNFPSLLRTDIDTISHIGGQSC